MKAQTQATKIDLVYHCSYQHSTGLTYIVRGARICA